MNKSDECDIVKDLAVPYVEKLINPKSKIFVEKHLKTCDACKKYYSNINSNLFKQTKEEKSKDVQEISFLKKFRRHMNILKISLIIILIAIVGVVGGAFIKYQNLSIVIDKAYSVIEDRRTLDNYKLTAELVDIDYEKNTSVKLTTNYYYKDGKYKIDYGNRIVYYEDGSYNKIYVFPELKQIEYFTQNFIEMKKGRIFDLFSEIISYKTELTGINRLGLAKRTDRFNGIDCYVIRMGNSNSYREVWIDKNTYAVLRVIEDESSKYYREVVYTLIENEATNEEVDSSILDTELYRDYTRNDINYNATKEIKDIYEITN